MFYELLANPVENDYTGALFLIQRTGNTCSKEKVLTNAKESKAWKEYNGESLPTSIDADVNKLITHISRS